METTQELVDRIEGALKGWPQAALAEVEQLGTLVRRMEDAQAVLRMGYVAVFRAVPESGWPEWDGLSAAIAAGWNDPAHAVAMVGLAKALGRKVSGLCDAVGSLPAPAIGRFAWGLLSLGVLAFAVGRRAGELAREARRATGPSEDAPDG